LHCKDHNNANIIYVRKKNPKKLDVHFAYNSALIIDGGQSNIRPKGLNQLNQQKIKHLRNTLTRILTLSLHSSHSINDGQKYYIYNTLISETGSCRRKSTLLNEGCATFNSPSGIALDSSQNDYIADLYKSAVRKVVLAYPNPISDFAGISGINGSSGDGGAATSATMDFCLNVAFDSSGNLYIIDLLNYRILKVDTSGVIHTFAGNCSSSYNGGDGGPATSASFQYASGLTVDTPGNTYTADNQGHRIRKVDTNGNGS
jgi:hypothetical protein